MLSGKIYKITSNQTENVYIGSTCKTLSERLNGHQRKYRDYDAAEGYGYYASFEIVKYDDAIIEELEHCQFDDITLLRKREQHFIDQYKDNCVNVYKAHSGFDNREDYLKSYHQIKYVPHPVTKVTKEQTKQRKRENYLKHKQKWYAVHKCICGKTYDMMHKNRHLSTKYHKQTFEAKMKNEIDEMILKHQELSDLAYES